MSKEPKNLFKFELAAVLVIFFLHLIGSYLGWSRLLNVFVK